MSEQAWAELERRCQNCYACPLGNTRTNLVFGTGNRSADLLFVGEAPGEQEDLSGIPFVGRAGQLLDKFLFAADIPRESVYIANILKCRPPRNRDPEPPEQEACIGFLREQLKLIQPKMIVCLGRISAIKLIHPEFKITRDHGKFYKKGGYLMTAIYHPSALLRDNTAEKKEQTLTDMYRIKEQLDLLLKN